MRSLIIIVVFWGSIFFLSDFSLARSYVIYSGEEKCFGAGEGIILIKFDKKNKNCFFLLEEVGRGRKREELKIRVEEGKKVSQTVIIGDIFLSCNKEAKIETKFKPVVVKESSPDHNSLGANNYGVPIPETKFPIIPQE